MTEREGAPLNRFRLHARCGEGATGTVFSAVEIASGRRVAVKILDRATPFAAEGAYRERAALARIRHPNVPAFVAEGHTSEGRPFLAVEWVEGQDLRARLARGPLGIDTALDVARDVTAALAAVHAAGIVHRDLKPANVMLMPDGRAKLLDFGIAQLSQSERAPALGTALYMAPELIGRRGHVDESADLYALGCLMFECIAGRPPLAVETIAEALLRGMLETPPRLRELRPETPAWVDELVARLLSKSREDRPRDASAVLELLADAGPRDELAAASGAPRVTDVRFRSFAFVRVGERRGDETLLVEDEARREALPIASICREFRVELDAPMLDVLVLTSRDVDPRDQLRRILGASLRVVAAVGNARVGVVTGSGPSGHLVSGAIARGRALVGSAPPGTVRADDDTRRLAPDSDLSFDGVDVAGGGLAFVVRRGEAANVEAPVGRDGDVAAIVEPLAASPPALVVVLGSPGIGKTCVLHAVRARTERAAAPVLRGEVHLDAAPFHAWQAWIRERLPKGEELTAALLRREATRLLGRRGAARATVLGRLFGFEASVDPASGGSRRELEAAVAEFARASLGDVPLFVDDAQWLDPASVATLLTLSRAHQRPSILVCGREEVRGRFPDLVASASRVTVLAPLGVEDSESLARRVVPSIDPASLADIVRDAAGHPLLVLELSRAVARGEVDRAPRTVLGLVQSKMLALPANARRVLAVASAIGTNVPRAQLARTLDGYDGARGGIEEATDSLLDAGLLVSASPETFAFATPLVGEAAYALIGEEERTRLHARLASMSLELGAEPAEVLRHATRSGDLSLAARAHVLAAERAIALFDANEALRLAGEGITWGPEADELGRLRLCEAEALMMLESYLEASVRASEAAELLPKGSLRRSRALYFRALSAHRRLDMSAVRSLFAELAGAEVDEDAWLLHVRSLSTLAASLIVVGLVEEGEDAAAKVENVARTRRSTPGVEAELYRLRARQAQARSEWGRFLEQLARAEALYERMGDPATALLVRTSRVGNLGEVGEFATGIELQRQVIRDAEDLGLGYVSGYAYYLLGIDLRRSGRAEEARAELARALAESPEDPRLVGQVHTELALDAIDRGALDEAREHSDRAIAGLQASPANLAPACAVRAFVALREGDVRGAVEWADRARRTASPLGLMVDDLSLVRLSLLEACIASGDPRAPALAREAVRELELREERIGDEAYARTFRALPENERTRALASRFTL